MTECDSSSNIEHYMPRANPAMKMLQDRHIAIDGFNLALSRGTGVATYARTLSHALKDLGCNLDILYGMDIDEKTPVDLREIIFFNIIGGETSLGRPKIFKRRWFTEMKRHLTGHRSIDVPINGHVGVRDFIDRMPVYDRILNVPALFRAAASYFRTTGRFLTITSKTPPEIMHWTYPLPIRMRGAQNIYTIHDLVPLTMPHTTLDNKSYHFNLLTKIVERADAICTVSEFAKKEIESFFPTASGKLFNTYQSFTPDERAISRPAESSLNEIRALFELDSKDYYLFFGSFEPKKNIGRIIESFLAAKTKRKLVLVGAMAWKSENELRFLKNGTKSGRIIYLEYLPRLILQSLILNAFAVIFPSLAEGFGLPVLEALSFGTPAIISREASLPEVGGDACVYVDAYSSEDITRGIEALETDPELASTLRSRAPAQAQKFSMSVYKERLATMYLSIL